MGRWGTDAWFCHYFGSLASITQSKLHMHLQVHGAVTSGHVVRSLGTSSRSAVLDMGEALDRKSLSFLILKG